MDDATAFTESLGAADGPVRAAAHRLRGSTEMPAGPANRIELSGQTGAPGIPRPRLAFDLGDHVRSAPAEGLETARELFNVLGATASSGVSANPTLAPAALALRTSRAIHRSLRARA